VKKRMMALLLVMIMALSLVACGSNNSNNGGNTADKGSTNSSADKGSSDKKDDAAAKRDDINIYCEGVWSTIDPHGTGATAYVNMYIINQAYEALVKVEQDGSITPVLATDWTISEDGLTYDFNIRQGVKFHNGEELKASDVVYSINRAMSMPSLESYYSYIASVEATGDYAVRFTLTAPYAPMMGNFFYLTIVNEKYTEENQLDTQACGTGPYVL